MDEAAQRQDDRRTAWLALGSTTVSSDGVPMLGAVVRDTALANRPGRVVDWDGDGTLTLEPPAGGMPWLAQLAAVRPDRGGPNQAVMAKRVLDQLDGNPLGLAVLSRALRATQGVVEEEIGLHTKGHDILTATDTLRSRQRSGRAPRGLPWIDDATRVQIARAVCMVVYATVPADPVQAALRWQRGVVHDRGALARVIGAAAERVVAAATIARAEAALVLLDGGDEDAVTTGQ